MPQRQTFVPHRIPDLSLRLFERKAPMARTLLIQLRARLLSSDHLPILKHPRAHRLLLKQTLPAVHSLSHDLSGTHISKQIARPGMLTDLRHQRIPSNQATREMLVELRVKTDSRLWIRTEVRM